MKFSPRKSSPSTSDKHWIHISCGGYNKCILISGNSCLPNCVGYAWGRFLEEGGITDCKLSRGNARDWYNYNDGYKRGQTPKLGAVICFGGSGNVYGHVAVVEEIRSDGTIVTSNSGYGGPRFYLETLKPPYRVSYAGAFQGFIYNPYIDDEPSPSPSPSDKYKVGDKVVIKGNLYPSSDASSPTGYTDEKVTNITRVAKGTAHPYNTTGDLGWMNESDIKPYSEPQPEPTPEPTPTPSYKFNIGDNVVLNGPIYTSSDASSAANVIEGRHTTVTRRADGAKHPYNTTGDLGWCDESSLSADTGSSDDFKVGDNVEITGKYSNSAYGSSARNSVAIGWKRVIVKIYPDGKYPYQLGAKPGDTSSKNTTGFADKNSIKKI